MYVDVHVCWCTYFLSLTLLIIETMMGLWPLLYTSTSLINSHIDTSVTHFSIFWRKVSSLKLFSSCWFRNVGEIWELFVWWGLHEQEMVWRKCWHSIIYAFLPPYYMLPFYYRGSPLSRDSHCQVFHQKTPNLTYSFLTHTTQLKYK